MSGSEGARRRNYISENMNKVIFEKPTASQLPTKPTAKDSPAKHKHFGKVPTYLEKFHLKQE